MICRVFNNSLRFKENAMLTIYPHLIDEWDFMANNYLGLNIYEVSKCSTKIAYWKCIKCGSSYNCKVSDKTKGRKCPYCAGARVNYTNSLASKNAELAKEWHQTNNGNVTPHDITCGCRKKTWWICKLGHEWEDIVSARSRGAGCPYCFGRRVFKGYNDIWTTNPEIASLLLDPEDGYKYSKGSKVKLNWRCECGEVVEQRSPFSIGRYHFKCFNCSNSLSYPERLMYQFLTNFNIKFLFDKSTPWSQNKRYDFYIPSLNMIIETHGEQHYGQGFSNLGGRSLMEEQENDKLKREIALFNGVKHYIEIDCRKSDFEFIKNNIIHSELNKLIDLSKVNWSVIKTKTIKPMVDFVAEFYINNKDDLSLEDISDRLNLSYDLIVKNLLLANEIGLCSFIKPERKLGTSRVKNIELDIDIHSREVIQFSKKGEMVKVWNNIEEIKNNDSFNYEHVIKCLKSIKKSHNSFIWLYKDEYNKDNLILDKLIPNIYKKKVPKKKASNNKGKIVVSLDLDYNVVEVFGNSVLARNHMMIITNSKAGGVPKCLFGVTKTAYGLIWMWGDNYEKHMMKINNPVSEKYIKFKENIKIVQLDDKLNFIKEFNSEIEAESKLSIPYSNIKMVCDNERKSAGGYKWMYKRDYAKMIDGII